MTDNHIGCWRYREIQPIEKEDTLVISSDKLKALNNPYVHLPEMTHLFHIEGRKLPEMLHYNAHKKWLLTDGNTLNVAQYYPIWIGKSKYNI